MKKIVVLVVLASLFKCVPKKETNSELKLASNNANTKTTDTSLVKSIEKRLEIITKTPKPRNYQNISTLNTIASYIKDELVKVCDSTGYQEFVVDGKTYKNVIGSIGTENKERIIIGAHYDVCGDSEGADDNASGVVGLLELANKLSKEKLNYRIDFVAYTLEEPPFFRTEQMGSYVHAAYLHKNEIDVKGMLCLESIGYFNDAPNSQNFPIQEMNLIYGNKGDFITIVQNNKAKGFSNYIASTMKQKSLLKTVAFKGTSDVKGIDFSDHLNYWKFNFDAVMITNTAFFRNRNYHTDKDVMQTLDLEKMSLVIAETYETIKELE